MLFFVKKKQVIRLKTKEQIPNPAFSLSLSLRIILYIFPIPRIQFEMFLLKYLPLHFSNNTYMYCTVQYSFENMYVHLSGSKTFKNIKMTRRQECKQYNDDKEAILIR